MLQGFYNSFTCVVLLQYVEMDTLREEVISNLRACLISTKGKCDIRTLRSKYTEMILIGQIHIGNIIAAFHLHYASIGCCFSFSNEVAVVWECDIAIAVLIA